MSARLKNVLQRAALLALCTLSMVPNITASTTTLKDLYQADKVRVKTWIQPGENITARQQVNLLVEIATDKWFSGGTRIGNFDVKDAIVLQREKFAVNSSRNEGGRSWTVQQWTLAVYPQREGIFDIPAIPVHLSIAGENLESIVGELHTRPFSFTASLPEPLFGGMLENSDWIVTSHFEIRESFNKSFDNLKPGDAVVRSISMSAVDLPAMMLPDLSVDRIPGIAIYPKPPQLIDKVNRGSYLAERTQVITYVFERPGEYQLPKQTFYWWNLETGTFETIELEAQVMRVQDLTMVTDGGRHVQTPAGERTMAAFISSLIETGFHLLLVVIVFIVAGVAFRKISKVSTGTDANQPEKLSERALRKRFKAACRKNNLQAAMVLFYEWLDNYGGVVFQGSIQDGLNDINQPRLSAAFKKIMRIIYSTDGSNTDKDDIDNDNINRNNIIKDDITKNNITRDNELELFAIRFTNELKKLDPASKSKVFRIELRLN